MTPIKAILFDLGDTLMHNLQPWPPVLDKADRAVADYLHQNGIEIDPAQFHQHLDQSLNEYYSLREDNLEEPTTAVLLQDLLVRAGQHNTPPEIIRGALNARYAISQANWQLEADALETMRNLQKLNIRMGLISNASDHQDVEELVQKFNLNPFLDFVLTSAACGFRKPHPHIFKLALNHWNFSPSQCVMIGDRLDADVQGAQQAGIKGIWLTRRTHQKQDSSTQPDGILNNLSELIPWIEEHE